MRFSAPLRLLPLLALLAACATSGEDFDFDTCGVRPRAQIPIEMRGNIPLMRATIKGQPATLVLDTGSVSVALTEQAMQRGERCAGETARRGAWRRTSSRISTQYREPSLGAGLWPRARGAARFVIRHGQASGL
jgi:hypothetical protein